MVSGTENFYCFFFGNDFLPEIPVMITNKNGIDVLFTLYSDTLINYGNLTSIKNEKVILNIDSCIHFFEQLSKNEELLLKTKLTIETLQVLNSFDTWVQLFGKLSPPQSTFYRCCM